MESQEKYESIKSKLKELCNIKNAIADCIETEPWDKDKIRQIAEKLRCGIDVAGDKEDA